MRQYSLEQLHLPPNDRRKANSVDYKVCPRAQYSPQTPTARFLIRIGVVRLGIILSPITMFLGRPF